MAKRPILSGYSKRGSRFVPPFKQIPTLKEYSYVKDLLPELLWLGLIHDDHGYEFGARVLKVVVESAKHWPLLERGSFATASAYSTISDTARQELVAAWESHGLLEGMRVSLAPLILLYHPSPLDFVGPPSTVISRAELVRSVSETVARHMDKTKTPAVMLMGTLVLVHLLAGTMHVCEGVDVPDLNSVYLQPDSEEAQHAAAFLRTAAGAQIGFLNLDAEWARRFWNAGSSLSECKFATGLGHDE